MSRGHKPVIMAVEGGDSVGKNETVLTACEILVAESITSPAVLHLNYPQFWSPTGYACRLMMREGPAGKHLSTLPVEDEARIRCNMFALDRAFSMPLLKYLADSHHDTPIVSDRGPRSNALTLGYVSYLRGLNREDAETLARRTLAVCDINLCSEFDIRYVLCVTPNDKITSGREARDLYESEGPQNRAAEIYALLEIPEVNVTENGKWRSSWDIASDCFVAADLRRRDWYRDNQEYGQSLTSDIGR